MLRRRCRLLGRFMPTPLGTGDLRTHAQETRLELGKFRARRDALTALDSLNRFLVITALQIDLGQAVPQLADRALPAEPFEQREAPAGIAQGRVEVVLAPTRLGHRRRDR